MRLNSLTGFHELGCLFYAQPLYGKKNYKSEFHVISLHNIYL